MSFTSALKQIFFHERYGRPDALQVSLVKQFAEIPKLTGILPYVGWLPDERMFILDQGGFGATEQFSLGFAIEVAPQTGATEEMEKILSSLFLSCPAESGIQATLYACPDINHVLQTQLALCKEKELEEIAVRRNQYYQSGTARSLLSSSTYLLRNFRCVISVALPLSPFTPTEVEEAIRTRESFRATLKSAYLDGFDWNPDHLLGFVGDFFDHERVFDSTPETKARLTREYDANTVLREQLSNCEIASCVSDEGIRFCKSGGQDTVMQFFSVRSYPKFARLNQMSALIGDPFQLALSMPCPFLITMGAIVQDHESARTFAQLKAARATQNAASVMARFQPDLQDRKHDWDVVTKAFDDGIRFCKSGGQETAMQFFSVRSYPKFARLNQMSALIGDPFQLALSMPCPFLITMGAIVQDHESARTFAQLKAARATQNAASVMARFQPDLQDRKHDWDVVTKAFDDGKCTLRMYHQICLLSNIAEASRSEHSLRAIWRARGYDLTRDYYLQHQAFASSLPMTLGRPMQKDLLAFGRAYTKTLDNVVMTAPLLAEWKGTKTPMVTLFGRRGQPMGFDLFDNTGGNYNFAVAALSGSGKSVFVNEMAYRYRAAGSKVWIIDVGRSYKNLCELMDGEFIEFADERQNTLCLNPFSMVRDINSDMEMLLPLLAEMASPREPLNNFCYTALASAIKQTWEVKGECTTITDIYEFLRTGKLHAEGVSESELVHMAVALEPYTRYGVYASYFEGRANIEFNSDFIVLELEELKSKRDLQAVVMQIIMYRITQEMYLDRSRRKLVIIDEAWDLMGSGSSGKFIESGYRRARKYGGAFGTITQSVEDYYKTEATKATINNADWLFLLRQKPENIDRLGKEGKLTIDEWMKRQLSSITTDHGNYSEVFVHGPMGSGIGRLLLDPFSMMLFSTRAEDFERIKRMRAEKGMTTGEAIDALLSEKKGLR